MNCDVLAHPPIGGCKTIAILVSGAGDGLMQREAPMVKIGIVVSAAAGMLVGLAFWVKAGAHLTEAPSPSVTMPPIEELHARVRLDQLPVQEFKDPF
jgi:hypothetical protein